MHDFWYRQGSEPLFPDLLWSRPENKQFAGKLLIIGGNSFGMNAPALAYQTAVSAGVGLAKVVLPESLHKTIGKTIPDIYFAPSNKSGGFSQTALADWLDHASWADCVLLAGDTARNSETAIVMEKFIEKYQGKLVLTQDSLDQFLAKSQTLSARPDTLVVASFAQLQKMWLKLGNKAALQYNNSLMQIADSLHEYTNTSTLQIITKHSDQIVVASGGKVSSTTNQDEIWRVQTSARASVWWLQNPSKVFEALTCSVK